MYFGHRGADVARRRREADELVAPEDVPDGMEVEAARPRPPPHTQGVVTQRPELTRRDVSPPRVTPLVPNALGACSASLNGSSGDHAQLVRRQLSRRSGLGGAVLSTAQEGDGQYRHPQQG